MTLWRGSGEEFRDLLKAGSYVQCVQCRAVRDDFTDDGIDLTDDRAALVAPLACLGCGAEGWIVRHADGLGARAVANRWGVEVARRGFVAVPTLLWDYGARLGLSPATRDLLVVLIRHQHRAGEPVYPSLDRLARLTGTSRRSVITHIASLENAGLLTVERQGRGDGNRYTWPNLTQRLAAYAAAELHARTGRGGAEHAPEGVQKLHPKKKKTKKMLLEAAPRQARRDGLSLLEAEKRLAS